MSPDVGRLSVYPEYAAKARPEAGQRWPVPVRQKVIVLQPHWKMLKMTYRPSDLNQLAHYMLRLSGRVLRQRRDI